ncbi:hypothetical protein FRC01_004304 [Tulasnella sp. 417]|nr:hypothetical protein FRC01_004304 [Tulasnella sp. 417]
MSNEPDDLEFRGEDLKECERFISAVNKKARAEGKFRDDQWIADLVGASMAGDALIWWSSLDDEVQESWKLLRKAMLSRYRLHFAGKSATEAEDFVHWIRQRALDAGKLNDPGWTAELASGCFIGSALRWYTALDPGIRGSWDSLQQAIFAQYSEESEEGFTLPMVPTPAPAAAAPNPPRSRARARNRVQRESNVQYSEGSEESLLLRMAPAPALAVAAPNTPAPRIRGRIRVRRENDREIYYLSRVLPTATPDPGQVIATPRMAEALEVEYDAFPPSDDTKTLLIPNGSDISNPCRTDGAYYITFRINFRVVMLLD